MVVENSGVSEQRFQNRVVERRSKRTGVSEKSQRTGVSENRGREEGYPSVFAVVGVRIKRCYLRIKRC